MSQLRCGSTPERIYEPNIIHNPFTWMGIWTPQGWRVHLKRFGTAKSVSVTLNGDGKTTIFPRALLDPDLQRVAWQDDLHLQNDPFTDGGIYPADPRVEYPIERQRWSISHSLMCYPVADHTLYTHEYTWDMASGELYTHFRRHVRLEQARTDDRDGMTVRVTNRPISQTIEGNVQYAVPNSAVRGVWADPSQQGPNLYTRDVVQLITMHNGVYAIAPHAPVVQCRGVWATDPTDPLSEMFDPQTGYCLAAERLIEQCHIPLDEPKVSLLPTPILRVPSQLYEASVAMPAQLSTVIGNEHLSRVKERVGTRFEVGGVGYAAHRESDPDELHYPGYEPCFDLNDDGVIDEGDVERYARHVGRRVRYNLYWHAYFGGDWLSISTCLDPEHRPGVRAIADYTYGAGYEAESGIVRLFQTPGPNKPVWVEYHYDAPAEAGNNNIRLHLYRE